MKKRLGRPKKFIDAETQQRLELEENLKISLRVAKVLDLQRRFLARIKQKEDAIKASKVSKLWLKKFNIKPMEGKWYD